MEHPLAVALLVASVPIILALVRVLGPRRASLVAILGVFLILPSYGVDENPSVLLTFNKRVAAGAALAAGVLIFDRKTLARFRPSWIDLPILVYVASPLPSLLLGRAVDPRASIDETWMKLAEWGVPYLLGRLYFADREALRELAVAIVWAGVLLIPVCIYEMLLGPDWYIRPFVFGINTYKPYANRLGGWRPEGSFRNGIELTVWLAMTAVVAVCLCASREARRLLRWRPWVAAPVLLALTIAARGAFGYLTLAIGLIAVAATLLFRTRLILAVLLLVAPAYIGVRLSGLWDGQSLVRFAGLIDGRSLGSINVRVLQEGQVYEELGWRNLAFGLGPRFVNLVDGWWIALLGTVGLLGVVAHLATLLVPAALRIFRRTARAADSSVELGLVTLLILQAIDSLMNQSVIAPMTLIAGGLAGLTLAGSGRAESGAESRRPSSSAVGGHATYRVGDFGRPPVDRSEALGPIAPVLAIACVLYVFGHAPVDGQDGAKFVGGLGSTLLFAAAGAAAASPLRHHASRLAGFALAFGVLGISFNLALHPTTRPVWSGDILQGMALSALLVALWRPRDSENAGAFAILAATGASWWAFGGTWRPFPGSQYLFFSGDLGASLFPVAPWLTMAALGAILARASTAWSLAPAVAFAASTAMAWRGGWPFGPPAKFPMNPTYALLGATLASAAFAASDPILAWRPSRAAADWLGRRWLTYFYIHLGVAILLGRAGLTAPAACWASTFAIAIAGTWLVTAATDRVRGVFQIPWTWITLGLSTMAVGLIPGVPPIAVQAVAGTAGLLFASRAGDLASLILGPPLHDRQPLDAPAVGDQARYYLRLAALAVALVSPDVIDRLPMPLGTGGRAASGTVIDPPPAASLAAPWNQPDRRGR